MKIKSLMTVFIFLSILPSLVLAQTRIFENWYEYLNIPVEYTKPPNILYFVILPFLGTFAIIFGILTGTRAAIFKTKRVNVILSLVFALAIFYSFSLPVLIANLFQIGAGFAVIVFFIVFIALTSIWGFRRTYEEYGITKTVYEKYKDVGKAREQKINKITEMDKEINKILEKIDDLRDEVKELEEILSIVSSQAHFPTAQLQQINRVLRKYNLHLTNANRNSTLRRINNRIKDREGKISRLAGQLKERKKERVKFSKTLKETLGEAT